MIFLQRCFFLHPAEHKENSDSKLTPEHDKEQFKLEPREENEEAPSQQPAELGTPKHTCPYCNYSSNSEMRIQAHVLAQHTPTPLLKRSRRRFNALCVRIISKIAPSSGTTRDANTFGEFRRFAATADARGSSRHWLNQVSRTPTPNQSNPQAQTPPNQMISPIPSRQRTRISWTRATLITWTSSQTPCRRTATTTPN